ncbi:MAG: hypothetical protein WBD95_24430 [Xanthobacteraceae bacterium]
MLVAREALNLVVDMVHALSRAGDDAMSEATIQAQYIAIVAMLRSVGHVLAKVDCVDPDEKRLLEAKWPKWKKETIFAKFIEPTRNDLLKEFQARLRLRGRQDIRHVVSADPSARTGATVSAMFDPATLVDMHGHEVMPLFHKAICFWDACLKEVEEFQTARGTAK